MSFRDHVKTFVGIGAACFAFGLVGGASSQQPAAPPGPPDVQTLGPTVGSRAPDFTLRDQQGQSRTLASLIGPNGLMLVFARSADWCPYCKTQLAELQGRSAQLKRDGIGVAAITYDPVPILADFARRRGITFPLLSDPGSLTIKQYGILNTTVPQSNAQAYGVPFPGTLMLSPQGIVTARFFERAYQEWHSVGSILAHTGNSLDVLATSIETYEADITSYATDATVAPGTHFSIVLDVRPTQGMHIYAPGITDYKPITLSLAPQAGLVTGRALYPPPEEMGDAALGEHVPVYNKPFRILQDVLVDPSPQGQAALKDVTALTIKGALSYQACTDTVCFNPGSLPFSWKVTVRPLDLDRANP